MTLYYDDGITVKRTSAAVKQGVVQGQRLMQATSDIYLGWMRAGDPGRHFYWRQLRDMTR
jgi:Uncharacterized protein conserved in bacteria (DUF2252)